MFDGLSLEQGQPGVLDHAALALHQLLDQHPPGGHNIRNVSPPGSAGGGQGRPEEDGVEVNQVELADFALQKLFQRRRPVETAKMFRGEVPDLDAVAFDRRAEGHIAILGSVHIGCCHMHVMAAHRQGPAQAMHRPDRAAVAGCREIRGNDVEEAHRLFQTRRPLTVKGTAEDRRCITKSAFLTKRVFPICAACPFKGVNFLVNGS